MTREETVNLLMIVQAAYPNFKVEDKTVAVNTWYMMLQNYEYVHAETALRAYIATNASGFAPSIGQIIAEIYHINSPPQLNEMQAWALVRKAISNSTYHAKEEFNRLPKAVQRAVGQPSQLYTWALDKDFNEQVVSSNFMRSYRAEVQRESECRKLPKDVRQYRNAIIEHYEAKSKEQPKQLEKPTKDATKGISVSTANKIAEMKNRIKRKE